MGRLQDIIESALGRVPDADPSKAWTELCSLLRTYVRVHMGKRVQAQAESMDVVNSMLESFLGDVRSGRLHFESEANLQAYLKHMTERKMSDLVRRSSAQKRGGGQAHVPVGPGSECIDPVSPSPNASVIVRSEELRDRIRRIAGPDDDLLWTLYSDGLSWSAIASRLGISPDAARKRHARLKDLLKSSLPDSTAP